ncbi:MAG: hypothetical protein ACTS2F_29195 [Thainema sp.]
MPINLPSSFVRWLQVLTHPDVTQRFASARLALDALQQTSAVANTAVKVKPKQLPTPSASHPSGSSAGIVRRKRRARRIEQAMYFQSSPSRPVAESDLGYVEIIESPETLIIAIANENIPVSSWLAASGASISCLGIVTLIAAQSFLIFPAIFVSFLLLCFAWELGSTTRVIFQHSTFTIVNDPPSWFSKVLGRSFAKQISTSLSSTGSISAIQAIIQHDMEFVHGKSRKSHRVVTIQTQTKDFSFGKGLKRHECEWIVQTILRWLASR